MGFSIAPKSAPSRVEGALNPPAQAPQTSRERAIARIMGQNSNQSQSTPVSNPTQVGMEEMGALKVPTQSTLVQDEKGAIDTTESASAAQATTPEAPKEPQATPKKEEGQPLSAQFAQLARKEKALRIREIELKRQIDAAKAQSGEKVAQAPALDTSKYVSRDDLKTRPFEVLAELGLSYETLTEQAANAPTADQVRLNETISELRSELKSLRDGQEQSRKAAQDAEKASYDTAIRTIQQDTKRLVTADERFETVKLSGSEQDVVDLITKTFHEGLGDDFPKGTVLSVEEAAQMVEDHLVEEAYNLVHKSKKLQSRLQPKPEAAKDPVKQPSNPQQQQIRTLTNAVGSTRQYTSKERALFAAQHGPNWREKVGA